MSEDTDREFESEKLLRGLEDELTEIETNFQDQKVQIDVIEKEEAELRKKLQELAKRRREFEENTFDTRKRIRTLRNKEIPDQEQRINIDRKNKEQRLELERQKVIFDQRTESARWKDYAMAHQIKGAKFLASAKRAICADTMGIGKTLQSLMYCDMLDAKRVLIVCPGDVILNFGAEVRRWTNRFAVEIGRQPKKKQKTMLDAANNTGVPYAAIINYESWNCNKDILNWLTDCGFDTVIVDEAHNIKELKGAPFTGVEFVVNNKNKCNKCGKIPERNISGVRFCRDCKNYDMEKSVTNFLSMTGSPILNKPSEIFPLLNLVDNETFRARRPFQRNFTTTDPNTNKEIWRYGGQNRLAEQISGMYIRRTLKDAGIELPPQEMVVHEITVDPEEYSLQHEVMKMLAENALIRLNDEENANMTNALSLILRQRQAATWPGGIWMDVPKRSLETGRYMIDAETNTYITERIHVGKNYQQSAKLDKAIELYHELKDNGHRVIFFSQFKEALKEVKKRLGDEVAEFHGDVSRLDRLQIMKNFDKSYGEEPKWNAIASHFRVGGTGVNFTAATAEIILDEEWNTGKNEQAYDRIHRIGQDKETQIHIFRTIGAGSVDKWMSRLIKMKGEIVNGFNVSIADVKSAFEMEDEESQVE